MPEVTCLMLTAFSDDQAPLDSVYLIHGRQSAP
jgi:hypothetical protein